MPDISTLITDIYIYIYIYNIYIYIYIYIYICMSSLPVGFVLVFVTWLSFEKQQDGVLFIDLKIKFCLFILVDFSLYMYICMYIYWNRVKKSKEIKQNRKVIENFVA